MPLPTPPTLLDVLTDGEVLALASTLESLMQAPEWARYHEVLIGYSELAKNRAFEDDPAMLPHWKSWQLGVKAIEEMPRVVLARARDIQNEQDRQAANKKSHEKDLRQLLHGDRMAGPVGTIG